MQRAWTAILERYGQDMLLRCGGEEYRVRALIQPIREKSVSQQQPTPLGLGRKDRFLYLGPPGCALEQDTLVICGGQVYRVQTAHLMGEGVCPYWRAVLYPRDEVVE